MRKYILFALLAAGCSVPAGQAGKQAKNDGPGGKADSHTGPKTEQDIGTIGFGESKTVSVGENERVGLRFTAEAGSTVRIRARGLGGPCRWTSGRFDPKVILRGPWDGEQYPHFAENDDGSNQCWFDSRLEATVEQDGTFRLMIEEYSGRSGRARVTLECASDQCGIGCYTGCPDGSYCPEETGPRPMASDEKTAPGFVGPFCAPNPDSCAAVSCGQDEHCEMARCTHGPCMPECVPDGGMDGCQPGQGDCGVGEECLRTCAQDCSTEDPDCCQYACERVSCPPVTCELYCEHGYETGPDGCPMCECAEAPEPPPSCPPVTCELYCEHGYETGPDGCPMCECAEPEGDTCGGIAGEQCGSDEYCDYPDDAPACGAADHQGTCRDRPEFCTQGVGTQQYDPVCGCDGQTYSNECEAHAAGVDVSYEGECNECGGCAQGETCVNCFGGPQCLGPDEACAF